MLTFHIIHTTLTAMILIHFCRKYTGILDFIERTNELEKAGLVALCSAFAAGSWLVGQELVAMLPI
jgi:hypothetical protein